LRLEQLAEQFAVSRQPVQQALLLLRNQHGPPRPG
jgi:DNA-binding GntR family transcriptional regulator